MLSKKRLVWHIMTLVTSGLIILEHLVVHFYPSVVIPNSAYWFLLGVLLFECIMITKYQKELGWDKQELAQYPFLRGLRWVEWAMFAAIMLLAVSFK